MRIQCDDDLYRVDRVYLGPKGKPWPFRSTYRALGFAAGLAGIGLIVWRAIGFSQDPVVVLGLLAVSYVGAQVIDKKLTVDRPIIGELQRIWQELVAPRPDLTPKPLTTAMTANVTRWGPQAKLANRWWQQAVSTISSKSDRAVAKALGRRRGRIFTDGGWRDVR